MIISKVTKAGFTTSLENIFGKTKEGQIDPSAPPPGFLGLTSNERYVIKKLPSVKHSIFFSLISALILFLTLLIQKNHSISI